jgi:predicted RNase H-like nuclease (RuvC/YqgF family)
VQEQDLVAKILEQQKKIDRLKVGNDTLRRQNRDYRRTIKKLKERVDYGQV